jgi:hypothetical protein
MKFLKSKIAAISIAIFLIISMGASMLLLPAANAHTPSWNLTTFAFINVAPNPVGVGQKVDVLIWLDKTYGSNPSLDNNYRFHNYNLTIIKPDGHIDQKIFDTVIDTTSSQYYAYTPDQVGSYTFIFTFPGQYYNTTVAGQYDPASVYVGDYFTPSTARTTLTVQQDQLPNPITSYPLPQEYWAHPIYGENTDWWSISSNWLGTGSPGLEGYGFAGSSQGSYPGDAVGPQTGHIMWTKSLQFGGVVGGTENAAILGATWFEGSAYNQRYTNPIIVGGRLYYTEPVSYTGVPGAFAAGPPYGPTDCVDLRTGQLIWSRTDVPALSFAYIYDVQDPQQHGTYPAILIAATGGGFFGGAVGWRAFDAWTGNPLFNVTNIPTGTTVLGPQGDHIKYVFDNAGNATRQDWRLAAWNSTLLFSGAGFKPLDSGLSPTAVGNLDGGISTGTNTRYSWNVSVGWLNTMPKSVNFFTGQLGNPVNVVGAVYNDVIIAYNGTLPGLATGGFGGTSSTPYTYFAINLNASKGAIGSILWMKTYDPVPGNVSVLMGGVDPVNRVFTEAYKESTKFVGYSMDTGARLWTTEGQGALDYYGNPAVPNVGQVLAYGKLYSSALGGIVYCYDTSNGKLLWTYGNGGTGNSTNSEFYLAYGHYPTFINAIGNGVVYTITTEHTVNTPIYKGSLARGINATDGTEIWTLSDYTGEFFTTSFAIADGFETFFNGYDNQIYSLGRGPSTTSVQAPLTAVTAGNNVVIQGTVTDISAGTKQNEQVARFANGVPVASDASMKDWMGYVYQQKPLPMTFTGVKVSINAYDPNGNYIHIGDATTNANGVFHYTWTAPNVPGDYSVYATFAGTNGYWPSNALTNMNVQSEHPTATPAPTQAPSNVEMYFVPAIAGLFVFVAIIGVVIILVLRKRP